MHDIRKIRENPKEFDKQLLRRGYGPAANIVLDLDKKRRKTILEAEKAQANRKLISDEVKKAKIEENIVKFNALRIKMSNTKENIVRLELEAKESDKKLKEYLLSLPNTPHPDIPEGKNEDENQEVSNWGSPRTFSFRPLEHFLIPGAAGLNFRDAAKISGSRFVILEGSMATLHRALSQFMLDIQIKEHGLREIWAPVLVKNKCMTGTGQLPKFAEDSYSISDDQWLIPTSEVSLTNIFSDKILSLNELPHRLVCHSQCFRSEAGSAGRDTSGMLRQHQFEKVEMVSITEPHKSENELKRMTECAQNILEILEIPYRTMLLCTGDIGFSAKKTYDVEVWLPGQNRFREISSCSSCGDFQSRRMNARYRPSTDKKLEFVHTLNGSGLAVGRCLIAVLENYQEEDGSILIPKALQGYVGKKTRISKKGDFI